MLNGLSPVNVPILTESDKKMASQFNQNCGPVSIAALLNQPYEVIHEICETYDWCEEEGIDIVDILLIIRDFGFKVKYFEKESKKKLTLAKVKRDILKKGHRYLIGTKGHVLAWVDGVVVDTYRCNGNTKVLEIIEVK